MRVSVVAESAPLVDCPGIDYMRVYAQLRCIVKDWLSLDSSACLNNGMVNSGSGVSLRLQTSGPIKEAVVDFHMTMTRAVGVMLVPSHACVSSSRRVQAVTCGVLPDYLRFYTWQKINVSLVLPTTTLSARQNASSPLHWPTLSL